VRVIRCSTLPLLAALLLLGQGPVCELLCVPSAAGAAVAQEAAPPCHGTQSTHAPAAPAPGPHEREHECTACDQIAASGASASKLATSLATLALAASPETRLAPRPLPAGLAAPDDRAPPGRGRDLLLRKSSLLI